MAIEILKYNFIITMLILIYLSWKDIKLRIIPHAGLLILSFFVIFSLVICSQWPDLTLALLVLFIGFLFFCFNIIGGGDVKLMALLTLGLPQHTFYEFLLLTAFFGGVLALFGMCFFRRNFMKHGVPYSIAITAAYFLIFFNFLNS